MQGQSVLEKYKIKTRVIDLYRIIKRKNTTRIRTGRLRCVEKKYRVIRSHENMQKINKYEI